MRGFITIKALFYDKMTSKMLLGVFNLSIGKNSLKCFAFVYIRDPGDFKPLKTQTRPSLAEEFEHRKPS